MTLDAMPGAVASIEATALADRWDGESHDLVRIFDDTLGVCQCGRIISGAGPDHVRKIHRDHAEAVTS